MHCKQAAEDFLAYSSVQKSVTDIENQIHSEKWPQSPQTNDSHTAGSAEGEKEQLLRLRALLRGTTTTTDDQQGLTEEEQHHWRQQMLRTLQAHVRFVSEGKNPAEL